MASSLIASGEAALISRYFGNASATLAAAVGTSVARATATVNTSTAGRPEQPQTGDGRASLASPTIGVVTTPGAVAAAASGVRFMSMFKHRASNSDPVLAEAISKYF